MFALNIIEPSIMLKKYVKCIWHSCSDTSKRELSTYKILADGAPGLIFHHDNGNSTIFEKDGSKLPISFIYGQGTKPCYNMDEGNSFLFGINFQPTALKTLFGIDADEATNSLINLNDIAGYNIIEELLNAPNPESLVDLFMTFLWRRLAKNRKEDIVIDRSVELIHRNIESTTTDNLLMNFSTSKRQYQRRFKQFVGVCPATYIRIIKFQRSLQLLQSSSYNRLSDIAYYLGYSDQSHFIREFKFFSDCRPKDVLKPQLGFLKNHTHNSEPHFAITRIILC